MSIDVHVSALARTAPSAFVAERNRRVAELKAAGEIEAARLVAALRKLGVTDWALNLAATDPATVGLVTAFCAAATSMEQVQLAAGEGAISGAQVRDATHALRTATTELAEAAAGLAAAHGYTGAGSSAIEMATRLTTLAPDRHALAALRAGTVGLPTATPGDDDTVPPAALAGSPVAPRRAATRRRAARTDSPAAADARAAEAAGTREKASRAERAAAERAHRELLAAARRQQRQVRKVERAVEAAEAAVQAAAERLADARARLATVEEERDEAVRRADELGAAVDDLAAALAAMDRSA